jgi:flagella basal body P-ring formation protein FlgA
MRRLLLAAALPSLAFAGCFPVTGPRILARDLALADPRFSALPSTLAVGFAPEPGGKRIFTAAELERLGRANGLRLENPPDICFELPMLHVLESDAEIAMRQALPADAELKIVELAKSDVPAGQLEFPLDGLEPPPPAAPGTQLWPRLWRGYVKYEETRRAPIWARVSILIRYTAVIANKDLPVNGIVDAASVRIESRTGPLTREKAASHIEEVSGRLLKRAVSAGAPIPLASLTDLPAVRRGDSVQVDVESGAAHLRFTAVAESTANEGDMIELRNPLSGKTFRARLDRGPRVLLVVTLGQAL